TVGGTMPPTRLLFFLAEFSLVALLIRFGTSLSRVTASCYLVALIRFYRNRVNGQVSATMPFRYPNAYRDEAVVDDYHGQKIPDPYSWLEDPDSEKTQAFVIAQNQLTLPFLDECPVRETFKERMTELYDYPKYSCPFKRGNSGIETFTGLVESPYPRTPSQVLWSPCLGVSADLKNLHKTRQAVLMFPLVRMADVCLTSEQSLTFEYYVMFWCYICNEAVGRTTCSTGQHWLQLTVVLLLDFKLAASKSGITPGMWSDESPEPKHPDGMNNCGAHPVSESENLRAGKAADSDRVNRVTAVCRAQAAALVPPRRAIHRALCFPARYFHFYNTGLQDQSVLYVQADLEAEPTVFLDPNTFSDDGTVALRGYTFSEDGEYLAYGTSASGSDWVEIHFLRVEGAEPLEDRLERVKFTCMSWTHDGKGLFYNAYPDQEGKSDGTETSTNLNQKLYYHVLGSPQSQDVLCAEFPDQPKWMSGAEVSDDGRYVLLSIREGCDPVNRLWYCDLDTVPDGITARPYRLSAVSVPTGLLPWVKLIDNFDAEYEYVTNEGTVFTFKTNLDAPRYPPHQRGLRPTSTEPVEGASPPAPQGRHRLFSLSSFLPPRPTRSSVFAACTHSTCLFVCYLHDVKNVLKMYALGSGEELKTFPLEVGSLVGFTGRKKDSEIFYHFTSFLSPAIIYHCDLTKSALQPSVFREVTVKGFNPADYQTTQVFYTSVDSTQVPMFIVHKRDIDLDGSHPAFLYGYGGFNISITPSYSVSRLIFVRHLGGVLAVANIRGGGEYGETWHKAGMLSNKQNCFTDFQCAAEYLIKEGYTSPKKLTINGGSNGGLLVGACVNQRPDLFGCAVAQVGVMDMLKFHKFTIGHAWTTDFGCAEVKEQFDWLIKYSPLHNIHIPEGDGVQYPAVLLLTGDHDDRVVPLHSLKYIATLQHVIGRWPGQKNPLFIHVDTKSGHGAGKPTSKVIQEVADMYAFIARCLDLCWLN
ncbi:hypothetical protein P4O66_019917, partial [Electrophorus voltai]